CLFYGLKIESLKYLFELFLNFCIAEVADAAFMHMVQTFVWREITGFNGEAGVFVCVAERNSFQYLAIDFLYTKEIVVFAVVKNLVLYLDIFKHKSSHLQAFA